MSDKATSVSSPGDFPVGALGSATACGYRNGTANTAEGKIMDEFMKGELGGWYRMNPFPYLPCRQPRATELLATRQICLDKWRIHWKAPFSSRSGWSQEPQETQGNSENKKA